MSVVDKITGTQSGDFTVGSTGPNPRKLVATASGLEIRDAGGSLVPVVSDNLSFDRQLINIPEAPGDTVEFRGWAAFNCTLTAVEVYCATVNTVGTYTLTVTNNATGNTVLSAVGGSYNMNGLSPDTVTTVGLTATSSDLAFSARDRWTVTLASNDAGMDASGVYISLHFTSS